MPFTYQGQLMLDGEAVTGSTDFRFSLWNASVGGTQTGTDYEPDPITVTDGLFTAVIETWTFGPDAFNGESRWLEIEVWDSGSGWETLSPRQMLTASPFALYAFDSPDGGGGECLWSENGSDIYYNTGEVGIGTTNPTSPLSVYGNTNTLIYANNTAAAGTASGIIVDTGTTSSNAIVGRANSSTGNTLGVTGYAYSPDGVGVRGHNGAATGEALGVHGRTSSTGGVGVFGEATATTGTASGVWGETGSSTGSGVFGQSLSSGTGESSGVKGVAWGSWAQGVFGYNGSTASTAIGTLGRTYAGDGVRGETTSTSGGTGVFGETNSSSGYGVYGAAPTGGKGVAGYSGSNDYGYLGWNGGGVYGYSANGHGVRGYSTNDWAIFGSVPYGSTQVGVLGAITLSNGAVQWVPESGVCGSSEDGYGVAGRVDGGQAVYGTHDDTGNFGYLATSTEGAYGQTSRSSSYGVHGKATGNYSTTNGVYGEATGATYGIGVRGSVSNTSGIGVYGYNDGSGYGGQFYSASGSAARFIGHDDDCVVIDHRAGITNSAGLVIDTVGSYGEQVGLEVTVDAEFGRLATFDLNGATGYIGSAFTVSADNSGNVVEIFGENTTSNDDVFRAQSDGYGSAIFGYNSRNNHDAPAIRGYHISNTSNYGVGVKGEGGYKGVEGRATGGDGTGTKYGVYGYATNGTTNYAGYFSGNLRCTGTLQKGSGTFMIDHPLDPENKYLYHSFVESPDMMNIYNGNVVLDAGGSAVITMPDYFEALNMEFRYQLTCIGGFAQIYVAEEIADNQFKIAGGKAGLKVSWQVTGVRQDAFANANRVQVEVDKPEDERGTYIHPEAFGLSSDLQIDNVRETRHAELVADED